MSRSSRRRIRRQAAKRRAKRFPRPPKHLSMFQVAVDPFRRAEYDPDGKKLQKPWNDAAIGFVCPVCNKSSSGWFFWIDKTMAACEWCAAIEMFHRHMDRIESSLKTVLYVRKLRECNENLITSMGGR